MMKPFAIACLCILMVAAVAPLDAHARGTKAERLDKAMGDMEKALEQKRMLKENEAFAKANPVEAKQCFDPMMATADQYGVERGVYFLENQPYYRECIEQLLAAK